MVDLLRLVWYIDLAPHGALLARAFARRLHGLCTALVRRRRLLRCVNGVLRLFHESAYAGFLHFLDLRVKLGVLDVL